MNEQGERILKELENIAVAVEGISGMLGDWIEANGDSITELPEEVRQELQIAGWQGSMAEGGDNPVMSERTDKLVKDLNKAASYMERTAKLVEEFNDQPEFEYTEEELNDKKAEAKICKAVSRLQLACEALA